MKTLYNEVWTNIGHIQDVETPSMRRHSLRPNTNKQTHTTIPFHAKIKETNAVSDNQTQMISKCGTRNGQNLEIGVLCMLQSQSMNKRLGGIEGTRRHRTSHHGQWKKVENIQSEGTHKQMTEQYALNLIRSNTITLLRSHTTLGRRPHRNWLLQTVSTQIICWKEVTWWQTRFGPLIKPPEARYNAFI